MMQQVEDQRHAKIRYLLTGIVGWTGALVFTAGLLLVPFEPEWGGRIAAFACGLVAVANEVDPDHKNPWWWRAGLGLIAAVGALYP